MAKVKLHAGAEIDVLTRKELDESLKAWMVEAVKGARPIRFTATATIASNAFSVDANNINNRLGPDAGFFWIVRRLAISGPTLATDACSIFIGLADNNHLVFPNLTGITGATGYKSFNRGELILGSADRLVIASTGNIGATGTVTVSGAAEEFPAGLLWKVI